MNTQLELSELKRAWVDDSFRRVKNMGLKQFTTDDLHKQLPEPAHRNWFGVLMARLSNAGIVQKVGFEKSSRPEANGRIIAVWEVV